MTTLPKIPVPLPVSKPITTSPALKRWTFAGLLMTYWCNAKCAFCYVYSGPNKRGPKLEVDQALDFWRGLNRLLPPDSPCQVHLAGGEPFHDFDRLLAIAQAAQAAGLTVLEKIETNAFWAIDDDITRDKIQKLASAGMKMLMISADVYHQEFVPVERCRRAARIAREILGDSGVRVRWWDFIDQPIDIMAMPLDERKRAYADALVRHRERIMGRAADQLADFYECHPPEYFAHQHCVEETLKSKHVHIDPYGNVFPGVCSGIVWGVVNGADGPVGSSPTNANPALQTPDHDTQFQFPSVDALWHHASTHWQSHPVISRVVTGGPYKLYEYAHANGYHPRPEGYANKCHLCHDVRRFLHANNHFGPALGPSEVYHESPPTHPRTSFSLPIISPS